MALTKKQIIEQYLWKYVEEIYNPTKDGLTMDDLYAFMGKSPSEQRAEVKAWAVPMLQERRDRRQEAADNSATQLSAMDADITEASSL